MPDLPAPDRTDPLGAIAAAAEAYRNWGRWGDDDVLGTLNHIDDAKRLEAARLVTRGAAFSLAQSFDTNGPQNGWRRRTNPVHTMLDTGVDASLDNQGFPHGFGGADDVVFMPLQASTQWDGLGHIFDRGRSWNGRPAQEAVTSEGDLHTGIETVADRFTSRGVLLDAGRVLGTGGELPDGFAITPAHLDAVIAAQGASSAVGRGDILLVRTGWWRKFLVENDATAFNAGEPGLSLGCADWLYSHDVAAVCADNWGIEVMPEEGQDTQPLHLVLIRDMGMTLGELFDFEELTADCALDGVWSFFFCGPPLKFTNAVGSPTSPLAIK